MIGFPLVGKHFVCSSVECVLSCIVEISRTYFCRGPIFAASSNVDSKIVSVVNSIQYLVVIFDSYVNEKISEMDEVDYLF